MDWWYVIAIICIATVSVLSLTLFFKYRRNWKIARIFLALLLLPWSAGVCLAVCKDTGLKCAILINFTILEDVLTIIFLYMTKRLKVHVAIALSVLSIICPVIASFNFCRLYAVSLRTVGSWLLQHFCVFACSASRKLAQMSSMRIVYATSCITNLLE
ncbi:unnamed protein product [Trichobilharzia szidati]|nr:unnamed protein product [Trichobilharzia szidati]